MPYRVVQWTTGKSGSAAVRGMVGHPDLELVGCYAWSAAKVGQDVGTLAGIAPIGVKATDSVEDLLALKPDCVAYMPFRPDFDQVARILESGCDMVTTLYMLAGTGYGDDVTARIEDAAQRGRSSLYATGIYPGHSAMVALAVTAMCTRIDCVAVLESLDIRGYANAQMFRAMGLDREIDDPEAPQLVKRACGSFVDQIRVMARALAVELDDIRLDVEFAAATETTDFGFMTVDRGRSAGFKGVLSGVARGRAVIQCQFVWKLGEKMTPSWPVEDGYVVEITGDPSLRCRLEPIGQHFDGAATTAMPAVNAIPAVCAAPPGIVNQTHLPLVVGAHLLTAAR